MSFEPLIVTEDYSDVEVRDIFISEKDSSNLDISSEIDSAIESAKDKICILMETGSIDTLSKALLKSKARRYLIVKEINEGSLKAFKNKIIVREMPHIHGNIAIIDEKKAFLFNKDLKGVQISDRGTSKVLQELFSKWFWENASFEFIEKKTPAAEITFDIPPIYGNDNVLIDYPSGSRILEELLSSASTISSVLKPSQLLNNIHNAKKIHISDLEGSKILTSIVGTDIFYSPDMPFSFIENDTGTYYLSFDITEYKTMPEKGKNILIAVKCKIDERGREYKFYKKECRKNLIDKTIIDLDGRPVIVTKKEIEDQTISVDLSRYAFYKTLNKEQLSQILEKESTLLKSEKTAVSIEYHIRPIIKKHLIKDKHPIYAKYSNLTKTIDEKVKELKKATEKGSETANEIGSAWASDRKYDQIEQYNEDVEKINALITQYNQHTNKNIDVNLAEVKQGQMRKIISTLDRESLDSLPKYGTLYQNGNKHEYVLRYNSDLESAMEEMEEKKIEDVTYHLE